MKEDVIIIGAGIGGLACGALLAHGGHKVTIFEKNSYLGGACSSYTKEGFTFDRGVHVFTSGLNGPYGEVFRRIGLDTLQFQEKINEKTGIIFYKQDKIHPFNINVGSALNALKPSSGKSGGGGSKSGGGGFLDGFFKMGIEKEDLKGFMGVFSALMTATKRKINKMFEDDMSVTDWANQYSEHPAIHGILQFMCAAMFCISAKKTSAAEFIYCFKKEMMADSGFQYPVKGGAQAVPDAMSAAIRKFGGEIHTNSRVSSIVVKGNKVQGVMVGDKQYNAPIVISNLAIQMTTSALVGKDYFDNKYYSRITNLQPSFSAITFKIAFDEPLVKDWAFVNCYHNTKMDFADKYPPDDGYPYSNGFFGPVLSNMDPTLAPPGKQTIIFGSTVPPKGPDWEKWKEVYWWDLKSYFPDLEKKMRFMDISFPKDLVELTGKPAGPVEGLAMSPDQVGKNKPSSVIPGIEGLYVVGDTAGKTAHGIGTQLACDSGIRCADAILGLTDMNTI
ncbi:MAG: NAD(P)/FAD-dependent oxidoreductase [Promethearchaeota archaeon]|nr:MAG: NAD(P)/FAD-dependent oxidoreductase [Candidatus Lokiarchaeota archaeon]